MNGTSPTYAIKVQGLVKGFGEYPVLNGLDLTLDWGRRLTIFGANGSGKTTLLRLLSTQYRPDGGKIWVGGIERGQSPAAIRGMIGVVAHSPMIYEDLTCEENLRFFGRIFGLKGLGPRIDQVLGQVGLRQRADQRARTLSHGMQKRLAIARAILHDPPILLLDEPESGLDAEALEGLRNVIIGGAERSRTVVMATHNVEVGLAWADEVAVLGDGRIVYRAERHEVNEAHLRGAYLRRVEVAA
ncbi:MAG: ABC transporter ATP-binding protein [SAR202 cluster bacterium]|nr:ABC transporter ATP-binding protein [SAR202 cluster bacterium]